MYLISLIPTTDNAQHDKLSYFSKNEIDLGSLVEAPYGRSTIKGIVYKNERIQDVKGSLKGAHFSLKKINKIISPPIFDKEFIETLVTISEKSYIHIGKIFSYITPEWYYESSKNVLDKVQKKKTTFFKIQNSRQAIHKSLENFLKQNKNTWIIEPTKKELVETRIQLEELFGKRVLVFSKDTKNIETLFREKHTNTIFLSTPQNLALISLVHIETLWMNNEGHGAYRIGTLPSIDSKDLMVSIYKDTISNIIFADTCLSFKTYTEKYKKIHYKEIPPLDFKIVAKQHTTKNSLTPSIFINSQIETIFKNLIQEKKKVLLIAQKTGLASKILCNDCKKQVVCVRCGKSVSLIIKNKQPFFQCTNKKHLDSPLKKCVYCQSWNLVPLGIGTDTIKKYIDEVYNVPTAQIDKRTNTTSVKIKKILEEQNTPVYITTEMGLPHLRETHFDAVIVVSFDSLLYSGNYATEEKIFRLLHLLSTSSPNVYFQTRLTDYSFLEEMRKDQKSWLQKDLLLRKKLEAPPYGKEYTVKKTGTGYGKYMTDIENILTEEKISYKKRPDVLTFKTGKELPASLHLLLKNISDKDGVIQIS